MARHTSTGSFTEFLHGILSRHSSYIGEIIGEEIGEMIRERIVREINKEG